jgi:stringent starvation protein B
MTSNRPYLVRALYEWISDNRMTPHLLVDATYPGAIVPAQFVQDGKIVLNISNTAVRALVLGNERIEADARFGGVAMNVEVPVDAVLGIYARENGRGMLFPDEEAERENGAQGDDGPGSSRPSRGRPTLKVIK